MQGLLGVSVDCRITLLWTQTPCPLAIGTEEEAETDQCLKVMLGGISLWGTFGRPVWVQLLLLEVDPGRL